MVTPVRKVLDISHWNTVSSWSQVKQAGIRGIIAKATEGTGYVDDTYQRNRDACRQYGLLFGAYHFATNSSVTQQVDHFLRTAGLSDQLLYALDWEDYGEKTMTLDQAREFLELMEDRIGPRRCVVYSGNRAKEALGNTRDAFFGSHRLWLAQYGSNPSTQLSWSTWWLWQYSDGNLGPQPHGCPGVSGDVDTNSFEGTDQALAAEWSGAEVEPPLPPSQANIDIMVEGDAVITINGRKVYP